MNYIFFLGIVPAFIVSNTHTHTPFLYRQILFQADLNTINSEHVRELKVKFEYTKAQTLTHTHLHIFPLSISFRFILFSLGFTQVQN